MKINPYSALPLLLTLACGSESSSTAPSPEPTSPPSVAGSGAAPAAGGAAAAIAGSSAQSPSGGANGSTGGSPSPSPMVSGMLPGATPPQAGTITAGGSVVQPVPGEAGLVEPAQVTLSPLGATFEGQILVNLASGESSAELRFTTDGSLPTASSTLYATELILTETTRLRARAFVDGLPQGGVVSGVYISRTFDVTSDMPLIIIDGYGSGKPDQKANGSWISEEAAFMTFQPNAGVAALSNPPTLSSRVGYHVRGQSSSSFEKTPYKVELWDEADADVDFPVLGMPPESDWALVGPYADRALIRHAFVYELGRRMGLKAPRVSFAEVYLNQDGGSLEAGDYEGIYMVAETIKNSKNRLDLRGLKEEDTTEPDISGGYIFKFDWAAAEEPTIPCEGGPVVQHSFGTCPSSASAENDAGAGPAMTTFPAAVGGCGEEPAPGPGGFGGGGGGGFGGGGFGMPAPDELTGPTCWEALEVVDPLPLNDAQKDWLTRYVTDFNQAIHETPIGNYEQYIDVPSFVDTFIINELAKNGDAYVRSLYFHKDRDSKIIAGPLWDFNLTMAVGGALFCNNTPEGWAHEFRIGGNDWFQTLAADPGFMALVTARWSELRATLLSQSSLNALVDEIAAPLTAASQREFDRWPVCEVAGGTFAVPEGARWTDQLQVMKDFMAARNQWLDSQL